ncbi:MAG TPA: 3D domain-containing protein [Polyangiaceae bacterium]|nr:3D domain-containing protein [Polyangiaceae bacterium]
MRRGVSTRGTFMMAVSAATLLVMGCGTAGSAWMAEPLTGPDDQEEWDEAYKTPTNASPGVAPKSTKRPGPASRATGAKQITGGGARPPPKPAKIEGKILGKFRNTYYDFPAERDYTGPRVALKDPKCNTIKEVAKTFHDAVCVQGSGTLSTGGTVSFAKRDCECAQLCPRTNQRICFDQLDRQQFPWGRGATGKAITPLLTVAVDSTVIPLGTTIYIPEADGLPRDESETSFHDGCFIAQDRGLKIKGKHVDVFTGHEGITKLWNRLVPSNQGVTVVLDNPRCARAKSP